MNKTAQYLNQHLTGEVATARAVREKYATDGSVLSVLPEMVAYPCNTNDIRKVMTFTWQLAEKGHTLPVTTRGSGHNTLGASIGAGIILDTSRYLENIFEYDAKQRLIRLQPGVLVNSLKSSLSLQGTTIEALNSVDGHATIGGVIANGGPVGYADEWIDQIEVVLANGDVLQTKRLSKRELGKKKALAGKEGEIYRVIDALIEENAEILQAANASSHFGYSSLANVKRKGGCFDLLPLFIGSQGTLGIISEMILKTEYTPQAYGRVMIKFPSDEKAQDAIDDILKVGNCNIDYFSVSAIRQIGKFGKTFNDDSTGKSLDKCILVIALNDMAPRKRLRKIKKIIKMCTKLDGVATFDNSATTGSDYSTRVLDNTLSQPLGENGACPRILEGMHIPLERLSEFLSEIPRLERKYGTSLPLMGNPSQELWTIRPELSQKTVAGKQQVVKLIDEFTVLAHNCGGSITGKSGEGRLQSFSVRRAQDRELAELFDKVREIFDSKKTLNTGVKDAVEVHEIAKMMR